MADSSSEPNTSLSGFSRSELSSCLNVEDGSSEQASSVCTRENRRRGPAYRSSCWEPDDSIVRHLRFLSNRRELAQTSSERIQELATRILSRPPTSSCSVRNGSLTIRGSAKATRRFCLFWSGVTKLDDRLVGRVPDISFIELVVNGDSWIFACPSKFVDRILWCLSSHGCIRDDLQSVVPIETTEKDKVGAGASGSIYTGTLQISGVPGSRPVAVKVLKESENVEKMVVRESSMIAAAGKHPNIICHHGIFQGREPSSPWYVVMDYYAFGDLWYYAAAQKGLEVAQARPILRDILSALVHLHERGILHRDVKPENVLIDEDHSATLCDFGVSCFISDQKAMQTNGFTNAYAAQELRWGTSLVTGTSSDVFGAGATLHYMLTLRYVFNHGDPEQKDALHRAGILRFADGPLSLLPKAWQDLLQHMVCLLPGRLTAAQALEHPALSNTRDSFNDQCREESAAGQPLTEPVPGEHREAEQPQPQSQLCFVSVMPQSQPQPQPQAALGSKGERPQTSPATSPADKKKNSGWYGRLRKLLPKNPFSRGAAKVQPSSYEVVDDVNEAKDEHVK